MGKNWWNLLPPARAGTGCETIGDDTANAGDVSNAELAAAMGADVILLNIFDVDHPCNPRASSCRWRGHHTEGEGADRAGRWASIWNQRNRASRVRWKQMPCGGSRKAVWERWKMGKRQRYGSRFHRPDGKSGVGVTNRLSQRRWRCTGRNLGCLSWWPERCMRQEFCQRRGKDHYAGG